MKAWTSSLALRLFLVAALWGIGVLAAAGILLSNIYQQSVERRFERELELYLNNLVAVAEFTRDGGLPDDTDLRDPRFKTFLSGWYWVIGRPGAEQMREFSSSSLAGEPLVMPGPFDAPYDANFRRSFRLDDPAGRPVLAVQRQVLIEDRLATFLIAGALDDVSNDVAEYRRILFSLLALFGAGFLLGTFGVVWLGLKPLTDISLALGRIRNGEAERLDGDFPREIAPLANEVNALIATNTDVVERARTHVGNLAHALKTPLSVLSNESASGSGELAETVRRQIASMREQIDYYLKRARVAGAVSIVSARHPVDDTLDAIARTLGKIHREKDLTISRLGARDVHFRGEAQDFEEIAGNLLENAFKWASGNVSIEVKIGLETPKHRPGLLLVIGDDGPGLAPGDRNGALKRGQRFDEHTPGSGLGLSIVADLVALYGGTIELAEAPLGGLEVRVLLPWATQT